MKPTEELKFAQLFLANPRAKETQINFLSGRDNLVRTKLKIHSRMTLLVTVLLMMIGFTVAVSEKAPSTNTVTALDIWMLGKGMNEMYSTRRTFDPFSLYYCLAFWG